MKSKFGQVRHQVGRGKLVAHKVASWMRHHRRIPSAAELRELARRAAHLLRHGHNSPGQATGLVYPDPYDCWLKNNLWNQRSVVAAGDVLAGLSRRPLMSLVMPVYNVDDVWLERAVLSVQNQVYPHWELCIADDCSSQANVRPLLRKLSSEDERIRVKYRTANGNISAASNSAAALAEGEFLVLLDQDDELTPDCLLELAAAIDREPAADLLYSDDDKLAPGGRRYAPQFKPDWSPELLLSYMYLSHVFCLRRALFEQVGGFRSEFDGCQDYDLALRASEHARRVVHIPKILYHWRALPSSTAASGAAKPESLERGVQAVQQALDRRGVRGHAARPEFAVRSQSGIFQIDFPDDGPRVSILIPTRNKRELLERCIGSIRAKTTYRNYEIVVVDNESDDPATLRYLAGLPDGCRVERVPSIAGRFSFAQINNEAARRAQGELLVFLNNDTEVRRPEWLSQLVGYSQMQGVGAVGARLLFEDGRVQHAGVLMGLDRGLAGHAFKLAGEHDLGYLGYAAVARNYSAVTAACMLVRRETFLELGGFDEQHFAVAYNDVDFGLRLRERGLRSVYAPRAELLHYENSSRGPIDDPREPKALRQTWGGQADPFYNPNLTLENPHFEINSRRATARPGPSQLPVRVLLCSHNLNLEGAPLFQYELARQLKSRGRILPEVHSPLDGPLARMYRDAGIPVHTFEVWSKGIRFDEYARRIDGFATWLGQHKFGVVHANTLVTFYAVESAYQAALPSVWNVHESADWQTYFHYFGMDLVPSAVGAFRHPYRVVFVSDATRHLFAELGVPRHYTTIHNGLARDGIRQLMASHTPAAAKAAVGCPTDKLMVSIVGTTCDRKGQHEFVQVAVDLLRAGRRNAAFYIVGCRNSPYNDKLLEIAKQHRTDIHFVEETDQAAMYYRASDVFVCCSSNESFPRVTLEAMAFGVPIVTTPVFGIIEQLAHEVTSLQYTPGDLATLKQHLTRLLDDAGLRQRLGQAALHRLDVLISYDEMVTEYEKLLLEAYMAGGPAATAMPPRSHAWSARPAVRREITTA